MHLITKLTIESVGKVTVSTVNLSATTPFWKGSETCLFWGSESEVVQSYSAWAEASAAHRDVWSEPATVAHAIHAVHQRQQN